MVCLDWLIIIIMVLLNIITVNVRGLRDTVKRGGVFAYLSTLRFDLCLMQEVHLRDAQDIKKFTKEWGKGESRWGVGGVHSTGVGILFGRREFKIEQCFSVVQGRVLLVDFVWKGVKFRVTNVYAPSDPVGRKDLFLGLDTILCTNRTLILGGDFNISFDKGRDISLRALSSAIDGFGLCDSFRVVHPSCAGFTWGNTRGSKSRIDFIFLPKGQGITGANVVPVWFTDHLLLSVSVSISVLGFGRGYWKLNTGILLDLGFKAQFYELYKGWAGMQPYFGTMVEWWEGVKERFGSFARSYGKWKAQREFSTFRAVRQQLQSLYGDWNKGAELDTGRVERLMLWQRRWCEKKAQVFRFKAQKVALEQDEKCNAFFFKTVKANAVKAAMTGLRGEDGVLRTDKDGMMGIATDFYRQLFGRQEVDSGMGELFLGHLDAKVPEAVRAVLELPISLEELTAALKGMKGKKVPGKDGIPKEFYEEFWDVLGPDLLRVFLDIFNCGELSPSMKEGVLSLLFKKGDPEDLNNWRPLTLLGVDYKLLARVMALRLGLAMPHIIHEDQTCGVGGRSVFYNLQLVRDVVSWVEDRGIPLVLVNLDQEKAFDRVSHTFLFRVLEYFGFGSNFLRWIHILYSKVGSRVKINGNLGSVIVQRRGVRQGCPLSPLLYVLYVEPLAAALRANDRVQGVWLPGGGGAPLKVSQYADDMSLFLTSDRSVGEALRVVGDFSRASGSALNLRKSQIKFFGAWAGRRDNLGGMSVCDGPMKILGAEFAEGDSSQINWTKKIAKVRTKLGLWKQRSLTLTGKVLVLKADILPSLVFLSYIFPLSARLRKGLSKAIFKFLWGSYEYVQRVLMYQAVEEGGRDVPCLPLKFDVLFFCNMCSSLVRPVDHKYQYFVRFWFLSTVRHLCSWDNAVPKAETLPAHYRHARMWSRRHAECKDPALAVDHRKLYHALRAKLGPVRLIGVNKEVWARLQPKALGNRLRDLNWLVVLNRLPVRDILYRHGISINKFCPRNFCFAVERVGHVFWDCAVAQEVWAQFRKDFVVLQGLSIKGVLFGEGWQGMGGKDRFLVLLLVSTVKKALWDARCMAVRSNVHVNAKGIVGFVRAELCWRFQVEVEKWGFHGAKEKWKVIWAGLDL